MKRCEGCGELVGHRVEICTHCGFRFDMTDYGFGKNKWVAIVLAFFLADSAGIQFISVRSAIGKRYLFISS